MKKLFLISMTMGLSLLLPACTKKRMQKEREKLAKAISDNEKETETIRTVEQERTVITEQKVAKF
jgi:hypothetical protein